VPGSGRPSAGGDCPVGVRASAAELSDAVDYIDIQGEGYGPLTNILAGTNPITGSSPSN